MAPSKLALRVLDRPLIPPVYSDRGFGVALRKRGTRDTASWLPYRPNTQTTAFGRHYFYSKKGVP